MINYLDTFIKDIQEHLPEGTTIGADDNQITLTFEVIDHLCLPIYNISNDHRFLSSRDWDLANIDLEHLYGNNIAPLEKEHILNHVVEYINWQTPVSQDAQNIEDIQHDLQEGHNNPQNEL